MQWLLDLANGATGIEDTARTLTGREPSIDDAIDTVSDIINDLKRVRTTLENTQQRVPTLGDLNAGLKAAGAGAEMLAEVEVATQTRPKAQAYCLLADYTRKRIKTVYGLPGVTDALSTLCPGFEYHDWDWQTVAAFLRAYPVSGAD